MLDKILSFIAEAFTTKQITVASDYATITATKRCGIVGIRFDALVNLDKGWTTLGTLPDGWRPRTEVFTRPDNPEKNYKLRISITTSGLIRLYNYGDAITSATNARDYITFVSGGGTVKTLISTFLAPLQRWGVA